MILTEVIFQDSTVCTSFTRISVHQAQKSKIHLVNTHIPRFSVTRVQFKKLILKQLKTSELNYWTLTGLRLPVLVYNTLTILISQRQKVKQGLRLYLSKENFKIRTLPVYVWVQKQGSIFW